MSAGLRTAQRRAHRPLAAARVPLRRPPVPGLSGRHARLGPARQRRAPHGALVQVSPAARHPRRRRGGAQCAGHGARATPRAMTPNLRATQVELYEGLEAHSQNRWPEPGLRSRRRERPARPVHPGGLLLQDLHVAATARGTRCTSRASAPPRASGARRSAPIRTATRSASPTATCWWWARARPGSPRRRRRPRPARASSSATSRPRSAARCCRSRPMAAATLAGEPAARLARQRPSPRSPPIRACTLLTRTTAFGYFPHNLVALNQRLTDHLPAAPADAAARAPVAGARPRSGARHRRHRATAGVPGQRPPRHHAGRRCAHLPQPLRRAARRAGGAGDRRDEAYQAALELQRAGVFIAAIADARSARRLALDDAGARCRDPGPAPRPRCSAPAGGGA